MQNIENWNEVLKSKRTIESSYAKQNPYFGKISFFAFCSVVFIFNLTLHMKVIGNFAMNYFC